MEKLTDSAAKNRDDEINLVDLLRVIVGQWKLILAGTALVTTISIGVGLTLPKKYEVLLLIEIGKIIAIVEVTPSVTATMHHFIENPQQSAARFKSLAEAVALEMWPQEQKRKFPLRGNLNVDAKNTGILTVTLRSERSQQPIDFLKNVAGRLINDHNRLQSRERQKLIEKLERLQNEILIGNEERKTVLRRIDLVDKEMSSLRNQIKESKLHLDVLLNSKIQLNAEKVSDPLALALFSAEIRNLQSFIGELGRRLNYVLPQEKESLRLKLQEIKGRSANAKTAVIGQRIALDNIIDTAVIVDPVFSFDPVSPNLKLIAVLSFSTGLFVFVVIAFVLDFLRNNWDQIIGKRP